VIGKLIVAALLLGSCQIAESEPKPLVAGTVPDGVPIFYQIYGSAEGSPVLLIHGFGGFFDEVRFERIIDFFSNYRLIGIDVRGHERSGKPSEPDDYGLALVEE
jgi:pimeloyl-ACP methyl ester carboxylesterase